MKRLEVDIENINKKEVLKYLGYRGGEIDSDTDRDISEQISYIENNVKCMIVYRNLSLTREDGIVGIPDGFSFVGKDVTEMLADCSECIMVAATLGIELEKKIRRLKVTDMSKSIILDSCASSAVERALDIFQKDMERYYGSKGLFLTDRFSPGYGDMPISLQRGFLDILEAERRIGLTLTSSRIMIPRKSVTAVIGIAEKAQKKRFSGCQNCSMFKDCQYRKAEKFCWKAENQ